MRRIYFAPLILAAVLPAQQGKEPPPRSERPAVHRPRIGLLSVDALLELHLGAERAQNDDGEQKPSTPRRRPPGMGRYLAAILVCADADLDLPRLFDQKAEDLLILSSPGPLLRAAELSMIERAVREHHVALCLVITHEHCETLRRVRPGDQETWLERLEPSRELAERQGVSIADAHGVATGRLLFKSSPFLLAAQRAGEFQVASLVIAEGDAPDKPLLRWRAAWSKRPFWSSRPRPPR